MKKLFYETEEFLKEKVEKIESEILALTDDGAACCVSDDKGACLAKLIEERKDALDALFQATPNEVMRMDKLNDQLKTLTHQMHERVAIVNEDAAKFSLMATSRLRDNSTTIPMLPMPFYRWRTTSILALILPRFTRLSICCLIRDISPSNAPIS